MFKKRKKNEEDFVQVKWVSFTSFPSLRRNREREEGKKKKEKKKRRHRRWTSTGYRWNASLAFWRLRRRRTPADPPPCRWLSDRPPIPTLCGLIFCRPITGRLFLRLLLHLRLQFWIPCPRRLSTSISAIICFWSALEIRYFNSLVYSNLNFYYFIKIHLFVCCLHNSKFDSKLSNLLIIFMNMYVL